MASEDSRRQRGRVVGAVGIRPAGAHARRVEEGRSPARLYPHRQGHDGHLAGGQAPDIAGERAGRPHGRGDQTAVGRGGADERGALGQRVIHHHADGATGAGVQDGDGVDQVGAGPDGILVGGFADGEVGRRRLAGCEEDLLVAIGVAAGQVGLGRKGDARAVRVN